MSSVTHRVKLVLRATGAVVDAELREGIQESNLRDWDDKWQPIIDAKLKKAQLDPHVQLPAAWHWNWRSLKNNMSDPLNDFLSASNTRDLRRA